MFTFGFSYVGFVFLLMLFIPNILWTKCLPQGYDASKESKWMVGLERIGEVLVTSLALICADFNFKEWDNTCWWLIIAIVFMILYEIWWIRYFKSKHTLFDFYRSMLGIPVGGATLPVFAFICLGIYGANLWMIISAIVLGIGHIGIHLQHRSRI